MDYVIWTGACGMDKAMARTYWIACWGSETRTVPRQFMGYCAEENGGLFVLSVIVFSYFRPYILPSRTSINGVSVCLLAVSAFRPQHSYNNWGRIAAARFDLIHLFSIHVHILVSVTFLSLVCVWKTVRNGFQRQRWGQWAAQQPILSIRGEQTFAGGDVCADGAGGE